MNVYLQPLKDELEEAWENGVKTYDAARKENFKMMYGACTLCMTCQRMRYSLDGVCMEGSRAPNARQLFSFIGCRRVGSILALTCIDSSWILTISSEKTRRTLPKVKLSKTWHHLRSQANRSWIS